MSQISNAVFGAIAVSLTLGAVQFASGHDLTGGLVSGLGAVTTTTPPETGVNRAAKADRMTANAMPSALTRTVSIRFNSLADTSVVIRIPLVQDSRNIEPRNIEPRSIQTRNVPPAPVLIKPGDRKPTVACEPVVSILTEVAKLLQPGRCVT